MEFKPTIPDALKVNPPPPPIATPPVVVEKKPDPAEARRMDAILVDDRGALKATTIEARHRLAKYALASEMVPKSYKTPEQVMLGMEYAIELGLPALVALKNIAIVNGTPSIFGELPLALVRKSGLLEDFHEAVYDKEFIEICSDNKNLGAEPYAAVCKMKRKGSSTVERSFSIDDAKRAGLLGRGPWQQYTKRMLQMRARSLVVKDLFPDVLVGIAISEYDFNMAPDLENARVVGEPAGDAKKLKDALNKIKNG
jgi:hypothetical protein